MCAKCQAMQNSFMGRYGAIIQAYQNGTYEAGKNYQQDSGECEEYKRKMQIRSVGNAGED